jgi:flagellar motor switch protein FliM
MNDIFTPREIELLLQKARDRGAASNRAAKDRTVEAFDFRRAGQLSTAQVSSLSNLHEEFAKQLGRSLSELLRVVCEVPLVGAKQSSFEEFSSRVPETAHLGAFRIQSPEGRAVVQADLAVVLPMLDLLLGGPGTAPEAVRGLTEIEVEIFEPVMQTFCRDLQANWLPLLETELRLEQIAAPITSWMPANEKVLLLKFEIQLPEARGEWFLVLPSLLSSALLRKLAQQTAPAEHGTSDQNRRRLQELLLESRFDLELSLPPSTVSVREIAKLEPGDIVVLKPRCTDPIHLNVAGHNLFLASPIGCGPHRGAQVRKVLSIAAKQAKEVR